MTEKEYRPKLDLPKTISEKLWDVVGYVALIGSVVFLMMVWEDLPAEVPAHYSASGEVNRWGSKFELLILPGIALFIIILLQFLEKRPHLHNYPQRINESNAKAFYLNSRKMLNLMKNICAVLFAFILVESVSISMEWSEGTGPLVFILLTFGLLIPLAIGLVKQSRIR